LLGTTLSPSINKVEYDPKNVLSSLEQKPGEPVPDVGKDEESLKD
jgi:hypothetical protein